MNLKVALSNGRILRLSLSFPYEGDPVGYRLQIPSLGRTGIVVGLSTSAQQSAACTFPDKRPLVFYDVIETVKEISSIYGVNPWSFLFNLLPKQFIWKQENYAVHTGRSTVGLDKVSMQVIRYVIAKGGVREDLLKDRFGWRLVELLIKKGFLKIEKRWNAEEESFLTLSLNVPFEQAYQRIKSLKTKEEKLAIISLVKERGFVSVQELDDMGFSLRDIKYLLRKGILTQVQSTDSISIQHKTQALGPPVRELQKNAVVCAGYNFAIESLKNTLAHTLQEGFSAFVVCTNLSTLSHLEKELKGVLGEKLLVLSSKERSDRIIKNWFRVQEENSVVLLGSPLSLLVPVRNVKLIALFDDVNTKLPKGGVDVRNLLYIRSKYLGAKFLIWTPIVDLQTYYLVKSGKAHMECSLSNVEVNVFRRGGKEVFSTDALKTVEAFIDKKVLFLVNKKGYSYTYCPRCQSLCMCPSCETFLTLYKDEERLVCTYCGFKSGVVCPECGGSVESSSFGIDRAVEEVEKLFGLRENFTFSTYPIFSGFYHLVVVLNADNLLSVPFFNAEENFYRYMWRARALAKEKLLIQTMFAEHSIIRDIKKGDWKNYCEEELKRRKEENLPPFSKIILASFSKDIRKSLEGLGVEGKYRKTKRGIDVLLKVNAARMGEVLKKIRTFRPIRLEIF
jgi:primosomal protein N' (replication factor Y)